LQEVWADTPEAGENEMTAYVVGFAFDPLKKVYLIRKTKPAWQRGLLNGIGGKIEFGESSVRAMSREFHEEAGVMIEPDRWLMYHRETWDSGNSVDFFAASLTRDERPRTMTDESVVPLSWYVMNNLEWSLQGIMYNLPYLIPMAYILLHGDPANLPFHAAPLKEIK
jgi:8-oxo-dGTP diphosphatase